MKTELKIFGTNLKSVRTNSGITQKEFAIFLGHTLRIILWFVVGRK